MSKIEWLAREGTKPVSWNPLRARLPPELTDDLDGGGKVGHHCEKVSPGCASCYAETYQPRFGTGQPYTRKSRDLVETYLDPEVLAQPLHWRKPRTVFVCSQTDLFGEWVPDEEIATIFGVMAACLDSTFIVLTKRPARMADVLRRYHPALRWPAHKSHTYYARRLVAIEQQKIPLPLLAANGDAWPLPNVWLMVSAEDQQRADERIPHLLRCPAAVRGVSLEPLLMPIDIKLYLPLTTHGRGGPIKATGGLDWLIVGGESGLKARPCDVEWIRSIVQQGAEAGCQVFAKQLGARPVTKWPTKWPGYDLRVNLDEEALSIKLRSPKGAAMSEWPEDLRVREWPR